MVVLSITVLHAWCVLESFCSNTCIVVCGGVEHNSLTCMVWIAVGAGVTALFQKNSDGKIAFSSRVLLLNVKGKQEERVVVVTNLHLYLLDVKKFKSATKTPYKLATVEGLAISTGEDQLVVVKVPGGTDVAMKLQGVGYSAEVVAAVLRVSVGTRNYSRSLAARAGLIGRCWTLVR